MKPRSSFQTLSFDVRTAGSDFVKCFIVEFDFLDNSITGFEAVKFFVAFGFILGVAWIDGLEWRRRLTCNDDLKNIIAHVFSILMDLFSLG